MRKINFRVWHKKESRWLDPWGEEDPMLCLKDFGKGCEVYLYDRQSKDWTNKDCQMDDVVIQQYAGLKDKSGVEIYEGDIIQHFAFNEGKTFEVKWCDYEGQWIGHGAFCEWENSIIVGNIFEGVDK